MKPVVFVFVKAPLMGKAKTRLAADIGPVHAQRIYRSMCARIIREMRDPRWYSVLYITPLRFMGADFGGLWPQDMPRLLQPDGDLSMRLAAIFALNAPVITIGSDAPQVRKRDIVAAIKALKSHDTVIGPAKDGGFWLLGINGPGRAGLFDNIRWSHPDTLADLRANLQGKTALLRTLDDIDDEVALWALKARQGSIR